MLFFIAHRSSGCSSNYFPWWTQLIGIILLSVNCYRLRPVCNLVCVYHPHLSILMLESDILAKLYELLIWFRTTVATFYYSDIWWRHPTIHWAPVCHVPCNTYSAHSSACTGYSCPAADGCLSILQSLRRGWQITCICVGIWAEELDLVRAGVKVRVRDG